MKIKIPLKETMLKPIVGGVVIACPDDRSYDALFQAAKKGAVGLGVDVALCIVAGGPKKKK